MGRGKRIAGAVSVFVRQPHLRRRREKRRAYRITTQAIRSPALPAGWVR